MIGSYDSFGKSCMSHWNRTRDSGLGCPVGHAGQVIMPPAGSDGRFVESDCRAKTHHTLDAAAACSSRLFGGLQSILFTSNHLDICHSFVCAPESSLLACMPTFGKVLDLKSKCPLECRKGKGCVTTRVHWARRLSVLTQN